MHTKEREEMPVRRNFPRTLGPKEDFAQQVRTLRKNSDMSLPDLARAAQISVDRLRRIENATVETIVFDELISISIVLKTRPKICLCEL